MQPGCLAALAAHVHAGMGHLLRLPRRLQLLVQATSRHMWLR